MQRLPRCRRNYKLTLRSGGIVSFAQALGFFLFQRLSGKLVVCKIVNHQERCAMRGRVGVFPASQWLRKNMGEDHKESNPERLLQRQRNITSVQSLFIITRSLFVLFIAV